MSLGLHNSTETFRDLLHSLVFWHTSLNNVLATYAMEAKHEHLHALFSVSVTTASAEVTSHILL
jgi:hypothetical protein